MSAPKWNFNWKQSVAKPVETEPAETKETESKESKFPDVKVPLYTANPAEQPTTRLDVPAMSQEAFWIEWKKKEKDEPILQDNPHKYSPLANPDEYEDAQQFSDDQMAALWFRGDLQYSVDSDQMASEKIMPKRYKRIAKHTIGFFSNADAVVGENIEQRLNKAVKIPKMIQVYRIIAFVESAIHEPVYSDMLSSLISDPAERDIFKLAIINVPVIRAKNMWSISHQSDDAPFHVNLFSAFIMEGLFFSTSFATIFWLKRKGWLPGIAIGNEFIQRDEGLHVRFGAYVASKLKYPIPLLWAHNMMHSAVQVELAFAKHVLRYDDESERDDDNRLGGSDLNVETMSQYIYYMANRLLVQFGYPPLYKQAQYKYIESNKNIENPYPWMDQIGLRGYRNPHEGAVTEYQMTGIKQSDEVKTLKEQLASIKKDLKMSENEVTRLTNMVNRQALQIEQMKG